MWVVYPRVYPRVQSNKLILDFSMGLHLTSVIQEPENIAFAWVRGRYRWFIIITEARFPCKNIEKHVKKEFPQPCQLVLPCITRTGKYCIWVGWGAIARRPPQIPILIRDLLVWGAGSGLPPGYVWCTGRVCFMVSIGRVRRCGAENGRAGGAKSTKIHPKYKVFVVF